MPSPISLLQIETALPPMLGFLASPISSYFQANAPYNNVILGALILTPPPQPLRILLLQRFGGADPHAFSGYWQVPSGKPNFADQSMLHAMARIIHEQTGLQLSHVSAMAGTEDGQTPRPTGTTLWMRMLFMVEVSEMAPRPWQSSLQFETLKLVDGRMNAADLDQEQALNGVHVIVDQNRHRSYVWATEQELDEFTMSGLYPVEETTQYWLMLEAFAFYRNDFVHLDHLRRRRQNAVSNGSNWP